MSCGPWGVQVVLAVDFASPQKVGRLETYDPLDPRVVEWWKNTIGTIYSRVPDLAGIVLEGRFGRQGRPLGVQAHARRCGQRDRARAQAARRRVLLPRASSTTIGWTGAT